MTLKELLEQLQTHRERLALWELIIDYLRAEYLPRDERPARKLVTTEPLAAASAATTVRQEAIEALIEEVETGPIAYHKRELAAAETRPVSEE